MTLELGGKLYSVAEVGPNWLVLAGSFPSAEPGDATLIVTVDHQPLVCGIRLPNGIDGPREKHEMIVLNTPGLCRRQVRVDPHERKGFNSRPKATIGQ